MRHFAGLRPWILLAVTARAVPTDATAQFWAKLTNPKFSVPVEHPPQVVMKPGTKIALRSLDGQCGDEIADQMTKVLFDTHRFEVIERSNVEAALEEQHFQAAGAVSQAMAVKLGAMWGPSALVLGRINRCTVEDSGPLKQNFETTDHGVRVVKTKFLRRTTAHVSASIRIVDLTTARVVALQNFDEQVPLVNESWDGVPEAPDPNLARSQVYARVTNEFMKLISPWTETVELTVYDDDKLGMKASANQMKHANFEDAVQTLTTAIEQHSNDPKIGPKDVAKAKYNLGVALMYSGHLDQALATLQQSASMMSNDIANEALATARKMIALTQRARAAEANALDLEGAAAATKAASAKADADDELHNVDVVAMAKAKLGDAIILAKIKSSPCRFDTSAKGLMELKAAGVSDDVILAMTAASPARKGSLL